MFRPTLLAAAAAACFAVPLESAGQEPLHVIVMADTASQDISEDARITAHRFQRALREMIPEDKLTVTVLTDDKATRRHLVTAIDSIPADSEARVVFFYVGHGYWNDGRMTHFPYGSLLAPKHQGRQYIPISDVLRRIRQKNPALLVTINDSCSVTPPMQGAAVHERGTFRNLSRVQPLARGLFFEAEGVVSINSSSPYEYSLSRFKSGSFVRRGTPFSDALWDAAHSRADARLDWRTFSRALKRQTATAFKNTARGGRLVLGPRRSVRQQNQNVQLYMNGRPQRL